MDVHRLAVSKERGVEEPAPPPALVPLEDNAEEAATQPVLPELLEGGSDSGRLGIWGSGLLWRSASVGKKTTH